MTNPLRGALLAGASLSLALAASFAPGVAQAAPPATPRPWPACTVNGTSGTDKLIGTNGKDVICGFGGDDILIGLAGDDILIGGAGDDILVGGYGWDTLYGGADDDRLMAGTGGGKVDGGSGRDRCLGPAKNAWYSGCEHKYVTGG